MANPKKTFYVTTPIYYPSGNLHIGHVYTTTMAWTLRNYKKLNGYAAKMLTGADEHGQKIAAKAADMHMQPQAYVDMQTAKFKALWEQLGIDYDYYSRTTDQNHIKAVQKQFTQLEKQGDIYKGEYRGWYSVADEEFFTASQATVKDGHFYHPLSGHPLVEVAEESYFFRMSKYDDWLATMLKTNPSFIWPSKTTSELFNNFLNKGLEDLSVSRSSFDWGIPIVSDRKHVMYVWLDALNNYITALGYNSANDAAYRKYWVRGDEIVHIVGKEITRFHCIYWPIILHAADIKLPTKIISHGWIVTPEGKMSKSKGNVIDPVALITKYGAEAVKYFFMSQIAVGNDGTFDENTLKSVVNADLANKYGNLVTRTLAMVKQNFTKPIINQPHRLQDLDRQMLKDIAQARTNYVAEFDSFQIHKALNEAIMLAEKLNKYIDLTQPWKLRDNASRLEQVLNVLLNGVYAVTVFLSVVMPKATTKVRKALGIRTLSITKIAEWDKFDQVTTKTIDSVFLRIT